jgi:hypothetical protein
MAFGCSDDDNPVNPIEDTSSVKVIHASPDAPGVDLVVDGAVAAANLEFPNNTGYLEVNSGTRNVIVNVAGTSNSVIAADLTVESGLAYSVFAVDSVSKISAVVLVDDLTPPAANNAHVRFVHLSPNAPAVDITLTDGTVVFGNNSFKDATDFTPLAAGSYDLQVRVAGTSIVALELGTISLAEGKIYTVFAKGFLGGSGDQALGAEIIVNN